MLDWEQLTNECKSCTRCGLGSGRLNAVIGRGSRTAPMLLIGEGPGEQEDRQGMPFVGPAGKLLDTLLLALMFREGDYYIGNIVKCRPPANRIPLDEEAQQCIGFLRNQVALIKPKIIVCLGATAAKYIIDKEAKISQIRGQWTEKKGCSIMPTFHPAALLRDDTKKELMWQDFKKVRQRFDETCQK